MNMRKIFFQGEYVQMIMIKNLTALVNYDKMKVRSEFNNMLTATISHDMRTPLNAIIGMT